LRYSAPPDADWQMSVTLVSFPGYSNEVAAAAKLE